MRTVPQHPSTSNLLLNEQPLFVLPSLAVAVGLNESIFLQQLHYWLQKSRKEHEGRVWIYNTIDEWQEQFPFWSTDAIHRVIKSLRKSGVLLTTDKLNKSRMDRTLWFAIDYGVLIDIANSQCGVAESRSHVAESRSPECEFATSNQYISQDNTQDRDTPPPPNELSPGFRRALEASERQRQKKQPRR